MPETTDYPARVEEALYDAQSAVSRGSHHSAEFYTGKAQALAMLSIAQELSRQPGPRY